MKKINQYENSSQVSEQLGVKNLQAQKGEKYCRDGEKQESLVSSRLSPR